MRQSEPEVVLVDRDAAVVNRYASAFANAGVRLFRIANLQVDARGREPKFDAEYVPLAGAERWNIRPIEDVIQLVQTSTLDRTEGWPSYILAGLALSPQNAVDVDTGLRAWARALLFALKPYTAAGRIKVKVPIELMRLLDLAPSRAAEILLDAERECFGSDFNTR